MAEHPQRSIDPAQSLERVSASDRAVDLVVRDGYRERAELAEEVAMDAMVICSNMRTCELFSERPRLFN